MTSNLIIDNNAFNWEALSAIATCIIGFMTIFLTFYPLYLYHFSRKVKVLSFSNNCSKFHGDGFDLILLNKTLSPRE